MSTVLNSLTILVHGTASSNRAWLPTLEMLQSRLGEKASILKQLRTFSWSGGNSHEARIQAGRELVDWIISETTEHTRINLIGHSHGGNVCVYASSDSRITSRVEQIITLGTPFISAERRKISEILGTILISAAFWTLPRIMIRGFYAAIILSITYQNFWATFLAYFLVFSNGLCLPFLSMYWAVTESDILMKKLLKLQEDEYSKFPKPSTAIPITCFTIAMDEAGSGLRFARILSELPAKLFELLYFARQELLFAGDRAMKKGIAAAMASSMFAGLERIVQMLIAGMIAAPLGVLFLLIVVYPRALKGFGEKGVMLHLLLDIKATPIPSFGAPYAEVPILAGPSFPRRALTLILAALPSFRSRTLVQQTSIAMLRHSAFFVSDEFMRIFSPLSIISASPQYVSNQRKRYRFSSRRLGQAIGLSIFYVVLFWPAEFIVLFFVYANANPESSRGFGIFDYLFAIFGNFDRVMFNLFLAW